MAENVTLARPYAEAAFQLAKAQNALAGWSEALVQLAALASHPDVLTCIDNPALTAEQLSDLCMGGSNGRAFSPEQQNFVRVLIDNERLKVLPEIQVLFDDLKNGHEGVKDAQITTAFALDDAVKKSIVADLEKKFACKIQATITVDPELIGGVRVAIGDEVIDASVRGKLAAMATALKN